MHQFVQIRNIEVCIVHTPYFVVRSRGSREGDVDRHVGKEDGVVGEEEGVIVLNNGEKKSEMGEGTS